jgi:dipeptidyl aminopeptidase/acylaminoacyl peptidase
MRWILALAVMCVAALAPVARAQTRLPAESYGRLPAIFDAAISPDGTRLVLAVNLDDGGQAMRVVGLDGSNVYATRMSGASREEEQPILRSVAWADDEHVMFVASATYATSRSLPVGVFAPGRSRLDRWRAGLIDLPTGGQHYLDTISADAWGLNLYALIAPIEGDPGYGRLIAYDSPYVGRKMTLYRVDLDTGRARPGLQGSSDTLDFVLNARGEPVYRIDSNERSNRWTVHAIAGNAARPIGSGETPTGQPPNVQGLTRDGRLVFVDSVDKSTRQIMFTPTNAEGAYETLLEDPRFDVGGAIIDPWSRHVVGGVISQETTEYRYFEPDLANADARLHALDPSADASLLTWSRDRTRFVAFIERESDAGGYYLFEPATNSLRLIGMRYPGVNGAHLGRRQAITYPARDGARIPAYLTLPSGAEARNLPLIVLVHGGPTARDYFTFDWWASFLASRGYAVVQPNFRGSGGYGQDWEEAGYRQWGALMQTDVEDAMLSLGRSGIIDPSRACIMGGSYGGYAALVGATLTPDRYRCAVSVAGVADLPMMLANVDIVAGSASMSADWWRMLIGDRREDRAQLEARSPAYQAAAARAPILLIHGANDTVVPIAQSRRMADRLRAAGKQVRLVEYSGEDHWLSDASTRIQMLKEMETFLAANLPVTAAP